MVGIVVTGQSGFMIGRLIALVVTMAGALAMMVVMPGMFRGLMASMMRMPRLMRMPPRCKQTVRQVQKDCTQGDEFEVLAQHGKTNY